MISEKQYNTITARSIASGILLAWSAQVEDLRKFLEMADVDADTELLAVAILGLHVLSLCDAVMETTLKVADSVLEEYPNVVSVKEEGE